MVSRKILKKLAITIAVIFGILLLLMGYFIYETEYKIGDIDTSASPDGRYTVLLQSIGEPDFPYGYSHTKLVLMEANKEISEYDFEVANDGCWVSPDQWKTTWKEDRVEITVSGEEQPDAYYTLSFDGSVEERSANVSF